MQREAIEEDLPEYADDRGHSAHHPGYRRRQLRFLGLKIFSQICAFIYFLAVVPVLRYGPNKRRFPFSEIVLGTEDEPDHVLLPDTLLDNKLQFLVQYRFNRAMYFAGAALPTLLLLSVGLVRCRACAANGTAMRLQGRRYCRHFSRASASGCGCTSSIPRSSSPCAPNTMRCAPDPLRL